MYFGTCQNWNDVNEVFRYSQIPAPKQEPDSMLFCFDSRMDYEGNIIILFQERGTLMMVDSGWCSCGGPDWRPEVTSPETLRYILDNGTSFHSKIFENLGYDIYFKNLFQDRWYNLEHENIPIRAYLHLDNLLTQMGCPPDEKKIAAIAGNSQTIWDLKEVFPDIEIQHMMESSVIRADLATIEQIRTVCPDVVILTFQEALGQANQNQYINVVRA